MSDNSRILEVLFTPAEFVALRERDLSQTVCVVFDILRATTSMMAALANGAAAVLPVGEIEEALGIRRDWPAVLLAGERDGLRIQANLTGGIDFDLGNSPREFAPETVRGRTIVMTTTNGTRALRSCLPAKQIFIGSFLGLKAIARWIQLQTPDHLMLVCSGTYEQASYEDTLAAGALCDRIWSSYGTGAVADSAAIAREIYRVSQHDLLGAIQHARNGRRLLRHPDLAGDVPFCLQCDTIPFLAELTKEGVVRRRE
jgi:2-phosphosulfolactate phosphatase